MTFVSESEVLEKLFSCNYACAVVEGDCVEVTDPEERMTALKALCARWAPTNDEARNVAYIGKHLEGVSVWRVQMQFVSGKARQPRA